MDVYANHKLLDALTWREQDILGLLAERRSDREIAQALSLELTTVKWYNREIYDKLGVGNRRDAAIRAEEMGLLDDGQLKSPSASLDARHNLPAQVTSFVGRDDVIRDVVRLISDTRLVTLTGPGGIGKTRLGAQVAAQVTDGFADGVWYLDLSALTEAVSVGPAIVSALGLQGDPDRSDAQTLQDFLHSRDLLLYLDNFEHLIEAAPLVADLLAAAPGLKVLVSSREALRLYGEQEVVVTSLAADEAARLFVQRAHAVRPDLTFDEEARALVTEICARLDGLPLAIELAAARTRIKSLEALRDQLSDRFALLTGGPRDAHARQQTLRATIDWSHDLLDADERALLARISVFQGGRTVEAVSEVCMDGLSFTAPAGLEALVNKALLNWEEGPQGAPRFVMLETIQAYAREKLDERGETDAMRREHAAYYAALAEQVTHHLFGGRHQLRWLTRFEAEHDNLRAALSWSLDDGGDLEPGLRLVESVIYFWFRQGHYGDWAHWSERALELSADAPANLRAGVLRSAGKAAWAQHDKPRSEALCKQAIEMYRQLGDKRRIALTITELCVPPFLRSQDSADMLVLCEEALGLARELADPALIGKGLTILGLILMCEQESLLKARAVFEECMAVARECGDRLRELITCANLGYVLIGLGDLQQAEVYLRKGLMLGRDRALRVMVTTMLTEFAPLHVALGQPERACRLMAASEKANETMGVVFQPTTQDVYDDALATAQTQLDAAVFEAARAEGRAMSLEEAIAYALDEAKV